MFTHVYTIWGTFWGHVWEALRTFGGHVGELSQELLGTCLGGSSGDLGMSLYKF